MINEYTLPVVHQYMHHIRANAESCVRQLLRDVAKHAGTNVLEAIDYLDDGSPVDEFAGFSLSASLTSVYLSSSRSSLGLKLTKRKVLQSLISKVLGLKFVAISMLRFRLFTQQ